MSDIRDLQAECSHLWKNGWCSECNLGWASWATAEIARLVSANEHWHVRVGQLKIDNEAWAQKYEAVYDMALKFLREIAVMRWTINGQRGQKNEATFRALEGPK